MTRLWLTFRPSSTIRPGSLHLFVLREDEVYIATVEHLGFIELLLYSHDKPDRKAGVRFQSMAT